jgi:GGDEF domain-containing protein
LFGVHAEGLPARLHQFDTMIRRAGEKITGESLLTGSFGAAFFPREGKSPEELLAKADERMYGQKGEHSRVLPNLSRHLSGSDTVKTP